jgi:hypothetical protein
MANKPFGRQNSQSVVRVPKTIPMQMQARASKPLLLVPNPLRVWNKKSIVVWAATSISQLKKTSRKLSITHAEGFMIRGFSKS